MKERECVVQSTLRPYDAQKVLTGHTDFESAFVQGDYPYGCRLRCKRAVWVETASKGAKKGQQRFMARTTNPRRAIETWNKPKASTYSDIIVLYLDSAEHVKMACLHQYSSAKDVAAFVEMFGEHLTPEQQESIKFLDAVRRVGKRLTWTINTEARNETSEERKQRETNERKTLNAMLAQELRSPSAPSAAPI